MGVVSEVATAITDNDLTSNRLRLKVLVKKPVNGARKFSQTPEVKCLKKTPIVDGRSKAVTDDKKLIGTKVHVIGVCKLSKQVPKVNCGSEKSPVTVNRTTSVTDNIRLKRKSEELLQNHEPKRLKMDRSATVNCQIILDKLMSNKLSYIFHNPVDPVVWGIDDYFDVIKKPMDLGTIKQKLQRHKYIVAEEFEADVRLTFSNAMLYNPPCNWVHQHAKVLIREFDILWRPFKIRMDRVHRDANQRRSVNSLDKFTCEVTGESRWSTPSHLDQFPGKVMPRKERDQFPGKAMPRKERDQFPGKAMPRTEKGPGDLKKITVQVQCSDLKPVKKDAKPKDSPSSKTHLNCKPKDSLSSKTDSDCKPKDSLSSKTHSDCKPKDSLSSKTHSDCKPKDSLSSKTHSDCKRKDSLSSKTHSDCKPKDSLSSKTHLDCKPKDYVSSNTHSNLSGTMMGVIDVQHDSTNFPSTTGSFGATAKGLDTISNVGLSPSKALRVAKLKSRFAETILKAQHHTLLEMGSEADKTNWQQEKELLQRRQHEEKAKIEAKIRAAKSAARLKEESEFKRQRQEAREAARMAIRKMERSVNVDDNFQVLKDLEALLGIPLVVMCHDRRFRCSTMWSNVVTDNLRSPLEQLGLYIKEEYRMGDDDYAFLEEDREEGELIC